MNFILSVKSIDNYREQGLGDVRDIALTTNGQIPMVYLQLERVPLAIARAFDIDKEYELTIGEAGHRMPTIDELADDFGLSEDHPFRSVSEGVDNEPT